MNGPFSTRYLGGTAVVALSGEIDLQNSPLVRSELLRHLSDHADLVVDLSGVAYIDSSGIASLVEAFQTARRQGTRFSLAAVSPAALRVLQLARLDEVFPLHARLDDAVGPR
jgi:anti-sigma B factor antagonist